MTAHLIGMQFRTPVALPRDRPPIELGTPFLALGSCFAERVGRRLAGSLFPVAVNPTGIGYNPISLGRSLAPRAEDPQLFLHDGLWRSLDHHSSLAEPTSARAVRSIAGAEERRLEALAGAGVLLLTLGTAQVFELSNGDRVVANCHRLNGSLFRRKRLSVAEAVDALAPPLLQWLDGEPRRRAILTVSPVRYLRDGLVENNRGKAVLLLACDELARREPRIDYFPAYEIVVDELRDYRFYEEDMAQPSRQAVDYVWEAFQSVYFEEKDLHVLGRIRRLQKLLGHRHSSRTDTRRMAERGLALVAEIERAAPRLDLRESVERLNRWR